MQKQNAARNSSRLRKIVGCKKNRSVPPGQRPHRDPEMRSPSRIQAARRLVQQKHARTLNQSSRKSQPLVHSARKFHDQRVGLLFQSGIAQHFFNSPGPLASWNLVERPKEIKILTRRKTWKKRSLSRHRNPDLPPHSASIAPRLKATDAYRPAVRQQHCRNQFKSARLPAAIRPKQRHHLATRSAERNIVQRNRLARPLASYPVKHCRAMPKHLANGFEYNLIHEFENAPRSLRNAESLYYRSQSDTDPVSERVPRLKLRANLRPTVGPYSLLSSPPSIVLLNRSSSFDLLCACSAAHPNPQQLAHIASLQSEDFDWKEFLHAAEHHGVAALAARNLIEHASTLPPEIRRSLDSIYATNVRRSLWFAAELTRIMRIFAQRQIRAIPYKGPALAQSAYGDLALRSFSDLDLLISPSDFSRARQALADLAYQPSKPQTPAIERLWLRTGYERSFDGPAGKNLVELQWSLLPYFYAVDPTQAEFRFDDLWARAGRISLGADGTPGEFSGIASDVPCLSPQDSLLVLCLHAAKHLWTRLIWVADIAESLRLPNLDPARVIERACALGITRILGISFWLAQNLLDAALPLAALRAIDGDPKVPRLGKECAARLARGATYDFESTEYFTQITTLRERRRDRMRYLWRLVWTPGPGDVEVIALPEFMFPLYRAVRIGRLLQKLASLDRRDHRTKVEPLQ